MPEPRPEVLALTRGDGITYVRVPSSLAWMVEAAIEAALVRMLKEQPAFMHDRTEGMTMVVLMQDRPPRPPVIPVADLPEGAQGRRRTDHPAARPR